jgi:uncharacterized DUF497 family protein
MDFRWIEWNIQKCEKHGVRPLEAEYVVRHAHRPYPRKVGDEKRLVYGQTETGLYLRVIYVRRKGGQLFVIHAMPMTDKDRRSYRRSQ